MEQQIQDLVASIRKEGIERATAEAQEIISKAKAEAESIIRDAEEKSAKMKADAEKAIAIERSSSEAAIKQAARDVSLSLRKSIEDQYSRILTADISAAMHGESLAEIIKAVISADAEGKIIEISPKDMEVLKARLTSIFAQEISKGFEFRPSTRVSAGFRISEKDGSGYIDVSPEKCQELLYPYLSENLKGII